MLEEKISKEKMFDGRGKCVIDGEEWPLWYAIVVNKLVSGQMPVILILGDPGTGKTYAGARAAYDWHNNINLLKGEYEPSENIQYDPLNFIRQVRNSHRTCIHKPDANTSFNSLDYNDITNRQNENILDLSRRWRNPLIYDAQKMFRCDKAIRQGHTIRLVARSNHTFDVYAVFREEDETGNKEVELFKLQTWKPKKPPQKVCDYIEKLDDDWKAEKVDEGIEKLEAKREQERLDRERVTI